jgi:hypothetical protein
MFVLAIAYTMSKCNAKLIVAMLAVSNTTFQTSITVQCSSATTIAQGNYETAHSKQHSEEQKLRCAFTSVIHDTFTLAVESRCCVCMLFSTTMYSCHLACTLLLMRTQPYSCN